MPRENELMHSAREEVKFEESKSEIQESESPKYLVRMMPNSTTLTRFDVMSSKSENFQTPL